MGRAIGIDLGTTNTAVAVLVDGRPRVLEDEKGYRVLPSCVSLKDDGRFVVGQLARSLVIQSPERAAFAVKRLMGRRFDSEEVQQARARVGYRIEEAPDGTCLVCLGDETFTPVELSAAILQVARGIAERALGEEVDEAVITVPAYFNHAQRSATLEAARLAGLHCERLLNEPTAAALAYGFRRDAERTIVVFDLGGGTFDVSVLHVGGGVYEVLATSGDTFLGGEDFDYRLVDYIADDFQARHGIDLRRDRVALQRLKDAAEAAKRELSFTDRTTVLIPRITSDRNLEVAVTRLTLEQLVQDYVDRCIDITRNAVRDAGLQFSDVDDVLLVGGQTRMPRVREAIAALFGREPSRGVHPEEAVAIGAAVHAYSLYEPDASRPLLVDVTPFDLGIDVAGGLFQPLILRNTPIPTVARRVFATAHDNQETVRVIVRQGDSRFAAENEFLGQFCMTGLTPAPRMETKVEVTFRIDTNGMLHVSAVEPRTGERRQITVRNYAEVAKGGGTPMVEGDVAGDAPSPRRAPGAGSAPPPEAPGAGAAAGAAAGGLLGFLRRRKRRKEEAPAAVAAAVGEAAGGEGGEHGPPEQPSTPPAEAEPLAELPPEALAPAEEEPDDLPVLGESAIQGGTGGEGTAPLLGADLPAPPDEDELGDVPVGLASDTDELLAMPSEDASAAGSVEEDEAGPADGAIGGEFEVPVDEDDEEEPDAWAMPLEDEEALPDEGRWDRGPLGDGRAPADEAGEAVGEPGDGDDASVDAALREAVEAIGRIAADVGAAERAAAPAAGNGEAAERAAPPAPDEEPPADDDDRTEIRPRREPPVDRRPARLRLRYRRAEAMLAEYRENLRRGGCFVRSERPLRVGRTCRIEVRAPGLDEPIRIEGVVTWSSADQPTLPPGQPPGMGIEYRIDEARRRSIEAVLDDLERRIHR